MMKSDGDLVSVSLSSYDDDTSSHVTRVSGYFASSTTPTRAEDSLKFNMVPCKQKLEEQASPNSFINFKESDSNGNDIRNANNL